jgi:hypothetical protein
MSAVVRVAWWNLTVVYDASVSCARRIQATVALRDSTCNVSFPTRYDYSRIWHEERDGDLAILN